ncbi:hypothetical protein [Iningainema tapete]|uniref:Uncharacterized protein n=1 Tax=Iningainema tapete BLCC-T55 TaxID=2748662 RepID=A0A8J6XAR0_9CYAN|nr:hypothetical protein [Iningainema tapete]MBD2771455.1 hypothetical protein [Iningainema tapete BLCC-T55]
MSESYQIFILIPNGIQAERAVYDTHKIVSKMGGVLDEDSMLILNETETSEPDPEYITEPSEALATLAQWSTYGAIAYSMPEFVITIAYKGIPDQKLIQAIKISIMERAFERGGDEIKNKYVELAQKLHDQFQANRTIMDWGLEYKGFSWREEIERLNRGAFIGQYAIVDLKDMTGANRQPIKIS